MVAGVLMLAIGGFAALGSFLMGRRAAVDVSGYFRDLAGDPEPADALQRQLAEPFTSRIFSLVRDRVSHDLGRFLPSAYVESTRRKLQLAGMSGTGRAEAFVGGQVAATLVLALAGVLFLVAVRPAARHGALIVVGLPLIGALILPARLNRKITSRQQSILNDLPDTLDLLAISVEAGMGFEGALAVVCQHFNSPLADEFALTLREMELGLSRHEAFTNLKERTDVEQLNTFVLTLVQADVLGIPIGRVLKTQSAEMRMQRRMWAREKAGKLPVKMLFPLMAFIFPPIFVVVLGPAMSGIGSGLR